MNTKIKTEELTKIINSDTEQCLVCKKYFKDKSEFIEGGTIKYSCCKSCRSKIFNKFKKLKNNKK